MHTRYDVLVANCLYDILLSYVFKSIEFNLHVKWKIIFNKSILGFSVYRYINYNNYITLYMYTQVETIGDAYMVASGLPVKNGILHAGEVGSLALHMLSLVKDFKIKHRPDKHLQLRIGIHSGR